MSLEPPRILAIINPFSGRKKGLKCFHSKVQPLFEVAGVKIEQELVTRNYNYNYSTNDFVRYCKMAFTNFCERQLDYPETKNFPSLFQRDKTMQRNSSSHLTSQLSLALWLWVEMEHFMRLTIPMVTGCVHTVKNLSPLSLYCYCMCCI